jgi:two-component system, cell cycle sensor histidine kinase and response regulator CckA
MSKAKNDGVDEDAIREQLNTVRQSEEHFRRLFEDSPMALWEADFSVVKKRVDKLRLCGTASYREYFTKHPEVVSGCMNTVTITAVNNAALEIFKADRKEFLRYGLAAIYGEKSHETFSKELLAIAEGKTSFEGDVLTHALTGEIKHIVLRWTVPGSYEDAYSKVLVGALNVTERLVAEESRKQVEHQARQAEKLASLSELSAKLSHDYNNMLMAILGYSDILIGMLGERPKEFAILEQVQVATRRAADITRQLMILSGKSKPTPTVLDATKVIQEMEPSLKERSLIKSILKFDLKPDLPPIEADATQLRQMIPILLDNAVEAIGEKVGIVTVRTGISDCSANFLKCAHGGENLAAGKYVYIEVVDTGVGMDAKVRSQLFVPFFTTKSRKGALDLSTVLGIMRGHNGAIAVESEVKTGTSFKLLFPVSRKAIVEAREKTVAPEEWKGSGAILVVDDEPMIRDVLKFMLMDLGFMVRTASDGRAAVDTYRKNADKIVAVLLDVVMPGMSSPDTLKELLKIDAKARVVLSSGASEDVARAQFKTVEGISGFIHKPYQRQDLMNKLYSLLGDKA